MNVNLKKHVTPRTINCKPMMELKHNTDKPKQDNYTNRQDKPILRWPGVIKVNLTTVT